MNKTLKPLLLSIILAVLLFLTISFLGCDAKQGRSSGSFCGDTICSANEDAANCLRDCKAANSIEPTLININYNSTKINAYVYKPESKIVDVILAFHGSVDSDSKIIAAAKNMGDVVQGAITRDDVMIISVAYPQWQGLLGDSITEAETALLWTQHNAEAELGVKINKLFLVGHSQGGYIVTRLNTMHETDGVVANAPGPIDLSYRCQLEEESKHGATGFCLDLQKEYGSAITHPDPYVARSLISFTTGHRSRILFTQGLKDGETQMALWPGFKEQLTACTDCAPITFYEIPNGEHGAGFADLQAIKVINDFLK